MTRKKLVLFYDVVSPYSYFGFEILCAYEDLWNLEIEFKPGFLGGVMHLSKNSPPGSNPVKAQYLFQDLKYNAEYLGLKIEFPQQFPIASLVSQRLLTSIYLREKAAAKVKQPLLRVVSRLLWRGYWGGEGPTDLSNIESVKQHLIKNIQEIQKVDASFSVKMLDELVADCSSDLVKQTLKQITEEVVGLGAFGMPFFYFPEDNITIFGSDRFPIIAHLLKKEWKGPHPLSSNL